MIKTKSYVTKDFIEFFFFIFEILDFVKERVETEAFDLLSSLCLLHLQYLYQSEIFLIDQHLKWCETLLKTTCFCHKILFTAVLITFFTSITQIPNF